MNFALPILHHLPIHKKRHERADGAGQQIRACQPRPNRLDNTNATHGTESVGDGSRGASGVELLIACSLYLGEVTKVLSELWGCFSNRNSYWSNQV